VLLVGCQLALGVGAWVVNWGLPSGWLPESWRFSDPLVARSLWGATVVTGHVVLGMMILGGAVVLAIVSGVLAPAEAATNAAHADEGARKRAFA
jgi:predicted phage tail protein